MRWDFGKVYKKIRRSKGLTQLDVCGGELSQTTLSKIENSKISPTFVNMMFLLNQIDMSLEEFQYICHLYQPSQRQEIINKSLSIIPSVGIRELCDIKKTAQNYLKTHHDIPIEHIVDRLEITIHVREHGGYSDDDKFRQITKKIWEYLEKQNTWYESDLKLLQTILFHFPIEKINFITGKVIESLEKYSDYHDIKYWQYSILANLASIYLYNHNKKECERITLLTLEIAKETKRADLLGMAKVRLGICYRDKELIQRGLQILQLTDENMLVQSLEEEVKMYY